MTTSTEPPATESHARGHRAGIDAVRPRNGAERIVTFDAAQARDPQAGGDRSRRAAVAAAEIDDLGHAPVRASCARMFSTFSRSDSA